MRRWLAIVKYEAERRATGAAALSVGIALLAGMFLAIGPEVIATVDVEAYAEALPPALANAFGLEALGTLAGFLATELYQFGWVLMLGLYFAYAAAGTLAGDVEDGRMDLLLATPVPRSRVVAGKYGSLLGPMLLVNVVVAPVVLVGSHAVGDPLDVANVLAVHALSLPYLLACAGLGLLLSAALDRADVAQRGAIGVIFGLFMLESLVTDTDYEALGWLSPTRYYDPTAILVRGEYDPVAAAALLLAAAGLVAASAFVFGRRDV